MADSTHITEYDQLNYIKKRLKTDCHLTLKRVKRQLQREHKNRKGHALYNHAFCLFIGLNNSGQRDLIDASEVKYSTGNEREESLVRSYITDNAVYIQTDESLIERDDSSLWKELASSIKHYRPEKPLDSIAITIDIADLCESRGATVPVDKFIRLAKALNTIAAVQPTPTPVYIILTHSNRIAGFSEFFAELNQQQRHQAWGVIIPDSADDEEFDIEGVVHQRYHNFLRRLNQQQIARIHATRSAEKRCLINEFPVQIEQLLPACEDLASTLFLSDGRCYPRGIFFTSAQVSAQQKHVVDALIHSRFALTIHPDAIDSPDKRAYFIHEIISKIIPNDFAISRGHKHFLGRQLTVKRMAISAGALATALFVGTLGINFLQAQHYLQLTRHGLFQLEIESQEAMRESLARMIPELVNIHRAQATLVSATAPALIRFPQDHTRKIKAQGRMIESINLQNRFLPKLLQLMEARLQSEDLNPSERYRALKSYLMLTSGEHLDLNYLQRQIMNLISTKDTDEQALAGDLQELLQVLSLDKGNQKINWDLIKENRKLLSLLPRHYLGYVILRDSLDLQPIHRENTIFGNYDIPAEFTHAGFQALIPAKLNTISHELSHSHWVFDENTPALNDEQHQLLADNILTLYTTKYTTWWKGFINKTQPRVFDSIKSAEDLFADLAKPDSGLAAIISDISTNTQLMPGNKNVSAQLFNQHVEPKFTVLKTLDSHYLPLLQKSFRQMQAYLDDISQANDSKTALLHKAQERFNKEYAETALGRFFVTYKHYPYPINQWVGQLAKSTWELMMKESMDHLNHLWFQAVYQEYERHIANRYPLVKIAKHDIPLARFAHFFNPHGTLATYFNQNIAAFLDTSTPDWRLKSVDGLSLPLTQAMVNNLERANIIREMYFPNKSKSVKVSFSLRLDSLSDGLSAIAMDIYGQRTMDYAGSNKVSNLRWPYDPVHQQVSIITFDENEKEHEMTFKGPWAIFHAIDKGQLNRDGDNRHYQLHFNFPDGDAKYELTAESPLNPFIPDVLASFSLSHRLTA